MQNKPQELALWGMFYGVGHCKYVAQRIDDDTVRFEIGAKTYDIGLSQKADAHTALVGFDGFFLRHGLARGTVDAPYTYRVQGGGRLESPLGLGPEDIQLKTAPDNIRAPSEYEASRDRKILDFHIARREGRNWAYAAPSRSQRHFIAVPKSKEGTRVLVCQLKPRSFERRYVMVVAKPNEVLFTTCNSY